MLIHANGEPHACWSVTPDKAPAEGFPVAYVCRTHAQATALAAAFSEYGESATVAPITLTATARTQSC